MSFLLAALLILPSTATGFFQDPESTEQVASPDALVEEALAEAQAALDEARAAFAEKDFRVARAELEHVVEVMGPVPIGDASERAVAILRGAATLGEEVGSLRPRAAALRQLVAHLETTVPSEHDDLMSELANLAGALATQGELAEASKINERVIEVLARTRPESDEMLLGLRYNTALMTLEMGDIPRALELMGEAVAAMESALPADHPHLLLARGTLASTMADAGDLAGARELQEKVLEDMLRRSPANDPLVLFTKANLAATLKDMGDFSAARVLLEGVLAIQETRLPDEHPEIATTIGNLAVTLQSCGDLPGARALLQRVLKAQEGTLPEDSTSLLRSRENLARLMWDEGDEENALDLQRSVLAAFERKRGKDSRHAYLARGNMLNMLRRGGDPQATLELEEVQLALGAQLLPEGHISLLGARLGYAGTLAAVGDLEQARENTEAVLAGFEALLPEHHTNIIDARINLARLSASMGDLQAAQGLSRSVASSLLVNIKGLELVSRREARETVSRTERRLSLVESLCADTQQDLAIRFALIETMRTMTGAQLRSASRMIDAELRGLHRQLADKRSRLGRLVARGPRRRQSAEDFAMDISELALERDDCEQELFEALAQRGVLTPSVDPAQLAGRLSPGTVAVAFRRIKDVDGYDDEGRRTRRGDVLLAYVLRPDATITRVDLGSADALEQLALAWRASVGQSLVARGVSPTVQTRPERSGEEIAAALRSQTLDPVLAVIGEARTLHVTLDSFLHVLPLDALPVEGDLLVGDRYDLVLEISFSRLLGPTRAPSASENLVVIGGVSYDGQAPSDSRPRTSAASPPLETRAQGRALIAFDPLPETRVEIESIIDVFENSIGDQDQVVALTGEHATRGAVHERAHQARFLHIATHGWFAPQSVPSSLDLAASERSWRIAGVNETVTGFAPLTLCGLALTGANQGRDEIGRVQGIMTAEELASIDLSTCELAVLSACETNVGIRRAGQGVRSFQAALHAAGARTAITSLWKVDDAATRRLMERFYTYLWVDKRPKAEALWLAKRSLRAEDAPVRDWAAWVLSGDPR